MSNSRELGRYHLVGELARGGMGVVYLAISSGVGGFNKVLVVKELKPELVEDAGFLEMFLEEARLAAQLSHPNIVTTYEVGIDANRPFIVMDYLEGQTLARALKRCGERFTREMQLRVLIAALDGLHYAHTREALDGTVGSVVHRDVSPQNVFVTYDGQVKVVDFGIAKASDTTVETRAGVFKGKPSYMAPEQLRGDPDGRADVFSIGVILWELLAGRRMWPKRTDVEILTALLRSEVPSIDEIAPDVPAELRRICQKGTATDLTQRYETARAMRSDLEEYLASSSDRTTLADVGAVVTTVFAEERTKVRKLVEKAIADSKTTPQGESRSKLPSIAPPPDENSHPTRARPSDPISSATSGVSSLGSLGTPSGATLAVPSEAPSPKRSRIGLLFLSVGALGLALFAGSKLRCDERRDAGRALPEASVVSPPSVAAAAEPVSVAPPAVADSGTTPPTKPAAPPASSASARYVTPPPHVSPAPKPTTETVRPAVPSSAHKVDCNPPFYFEGTKKMFKPGCL